MATSKLLDSFTFPHQKKLCIEGLQGRHALGIGILVRTLACLRERERRGKAGQEIVYVCMRVNVCM